MGIFDRFKNMVRGNEDSSKNWDRIEREEEVGRIIQKSEEKPQILYKHSPACGTSWFAKNSLEGTFEELEQQADLFQIDVINERSISNYISKALGIRHESPQILILHNGEVIWHASHGGVKGDKVFEVLTNLQKAP